MKFVPTAPSKHITDMFHRTLNTHNGYTFILNNHNQLSIKPSNNLLIYTNITTKEAEQLKTCQITIRQLIDKTQTLFLVNHETNEITRHTPEELEEYLPEYDDYHYPIA